MIMPIFSVKNVDSAVAFFREKLGFKHGMSQTGQDGQTTFAIVDLGQSVHIGLSITNATINPAPGVQFMIYLPDDVDIDQYYAQVKGHGIAITEEIKTEYWGDRIFSFDDPNGFHLTFCKTVQQMNFNEIPNVKAGQDA